MKKPVMVMPPIYNFPNLRAPENCWGWHRASEVLEVAQNLLTLQGRALEAGAICEAYLETKPQGYHTCVTDGSLYQSIVGNDWLVIHAKKDSYIPAKMGMILINAIKYPTLRKVKRLFV